MSATNSQRTDRMYLFDMIRSASLESKLLIVAKAHLGEFEDVFTDNVIEGATRIVLATNDDQSRCELLLRDLASRAVETAAGALLVLVLFCTRTYHMHR